MPDQIIPKSIATPGLLAHILTAKFADALPFYRQEKQFKRLGVDIPRATMCGWAMKTADACDIILAMMKKAVLQSDVINIDETPVQVLKEPGRIKSYMWVFKGTSRGRPVLLYHYDPSRSGDVPASFLNGYKGIVQTDGYAGYGFLDQKKDILHVGCWVHARRKFVEVTKAVSRKTKTPVGNAATALKYIGKLYKIEKAARVEQLSPPEIYEKRQTEAAPILEEFKKWLDASVEKVPPKSLLGKAVNYTLNEWGRLIRYIEDGRVGPDNNAVENAIRPFVVGRKNWLFSCTPEGARASAAIYSLIETAKANGLEPYWYLKHLFENLPEAMSEEDFQALLPQQIDKDQIAVPTP
jgi:transposase